MRARRLSHLSIAVSGVLPEGLWWLWWSQTVHDTD